MITQTETDLAKTTQQPPYSPAASETRLVSMSLESQMFMPTTTEEAIKFCEQAAQTDFVPPHFKGKGFAVFLAWQMGAQVGLDFYASIQNIAVINGRPTIWGDAALAVIKNHPHFLRMTETYTGSIEKGDMVAICIIWTKTDADPIKRTFSIADAIRAKLWEKAGPWQQYPQRMLMYRARGFAMRDSIPGALKGLSVREEVIDLPPEDYEDITNKPPKKLLGNEAMREATGADSANTTEASATQKASAAKTVQGMVDNVNGKLQDIPDSLQDQPRRNEEVDTHIDPVTGEVTSLASSPEYFEKLKREMEYALDPAELISISDKAAKAGLTSTQRDELKKIYILTQKRHADEKLARDKKGTAK